MGISLSRCDNQMDYAWGLASDDFKVKLDELLMSLK